jgi:hypothetical protein
LALRADKPSFAMRNRIISGTLMMLELKHCVAKRADGAFEAHEQRIP